MNLSSIRFNSTKLASRGTPCGVPKNINNHNKSNRPIKLSIESHFPNAAKFPHVIYQKTFITPRERDADKLLITMRGNEILGSCYCNTSHFPLRRCNEDGKISEEEVLEIYLGEESSGHRSLETIHWYSSNCECQGHRSQDTSHSNSRNHGGRGCRSSMTSHYASSNHGGFVYRGGYMSQDTSHYSSFNRGTIVDL